MKSVTDRQTKEANAKLIKEKELSKVKINKDDVDLIVSEIWDTVTSYICCYDNCQIRIN